MTLRCTDCGLPNAHIFTRSGNFCDGHCAAASGVEPWCSMTPQRIADWDVVFHATTAPGGSPVSKEL